MYSFNKYLLVISKDYWGTCTSEQSALDFSSKFANFLDIPTCNITHLIGNNVNLESVKNVIVDYVYISLLNNNYNPVLYIYINGHGNQICDTNGDEIITISEYQTPKDNMDEVYQLPDGNLIDDELTSLIDEAVYNSHCLDRPTVILFSDHCCSGSMLDNTANYYDWISFGSSLDYQDSYVSGDGNVMTINLLSVLEHNKSNLKNLTALDFFKSLDMEMKGSFIGEIQSCTFHVSHDNMVNYKVFL